MSTEHFTKTPGANVLPSTNDPTMSLIVGGDLVPDTVRLPPDLGGFHVRVKAGSYIDCPCQGGHTVINLETDHDRIQVAECPSRGFLWYRRPA